MVGINMKKEGYTIVELPVFSDVASGTAVLVFKSSFDWVLESLTFTCPGREDVVIEIPEEYRTYNGKKTILAIN